MRTCVLSRVSGHQQHSLGWSCGRGKNQVQGSVQGFGPCRAWIFQATGIWYFLMFSSTVNRVIPSDSAWDMSNLSSRYFISVYHTESLFKLRWKLVKVGGYEDFPGQSPRLAFDYPVCIRREAGNRFARPLYNHFFPLQNPFDEGRKIGFGVSDGIDYHGIFDSNQIWSGLNIMPT